MCTHYKLRTIHLNIIRLLSSFARKIGCWFSLFIYLFAAIFRLIWSKWLSGLSWYISIICGCVSTLLSFDCKFCSKCQICSISCQFPFYFNKSEIDLSIVMILIQANKYTHTHTKSAFTMISIFDVVACSPEANNWTPTKFDSQFNSWNKKYCVSLDSMP